MGWGEWDVQEWVGGAVGGMRVYRWRIGIYRFSGYTSNEDLFWMFCKFGRWMCGVPSCVEWFLCGSDKKNRSAQRTENAGINHMLPRITGSFALNSVVDQSVVS